LHPTKESKGIGSDSPYSKRIRRRKKRRNSKITWKKNYVSKDRIEEVR
jgi:hypothetical protein